MLLSMIFPEVEVPPVSAAKDASGAAEHTALPTDQRAKFPSCFGCAWDPEEM